MFTKPVLTVPPTGLAVSLEAAKLVCDVNWPEDDGLITAFIEEAQDFLDGPTGALGRFILPQIWAMTAEIFPHRLMRLPFVDVSTVTITYLDEAADVQTVDEGLYTLASDDRSAIITFHDDWAPPVVNSAPYPITIQMGVGYSATQGVPQKLQGAIKQMVRQKYDNRAGLNEGFTEIPQGVSRLIQDFRTRKL
jgi:uncharacterized phiE125 gp8 family phage protein